MKTLHTLWVPDNTNNFIQAGQFYLWVETLDKGRKKRSQKIPSHPFHLEEDEWPAFLETLSLKFTAYQVKNLLDTQILHLPSVGDSPLPSPESARYRTDEVTADQAVLRAWKADCLVLEHPIKQLADIHFLTFYHATETQAGGDFLFWHWFTQELKHLLLRDHYIPALVYRERSQTKSTRRSTSYEIYACWQWASDHYEKLIRQAAECMPAACAAALEKPVEPESLLRHCAEVLLNQILRQTRFPAVFSKKIENTLLEACQSPRFSNIPWKPSGTGLDIYQQWQNWQQHIMGFAQEAEFTLAFQLLEAPPDEKENWRLQFVVTPKHDPSLRLSLSDYWAMPRQSRQKIRKYVGRNFEKHVLLSLGHAARMVPKLWQGLDTAEPQSLSLNLDEAFEFLKESAFLLEDAGFKVIVPAWWTPQGRRRVKIRLRSSGSKKPSSAGANKSNFSFENLVRYSYQLAIGDEVVNEDEWMQLVEAKTPLVHFRGQWVELDRDKMKEMLEFWHKHGRENPEMSIQELLQKTAEDDTFEIDRSDVLAEMLAGLRDHSKLEPVNNPLHLKADLREYQKRGVAWLNYLEQLGLNGCLADDMGLGKTMQVIARLILEREGRDKPAPTLLIAPTSVIGNWQKEVEKFAPHLKALIHHGPKREQESEAFKTLALQQDMLITSYTLARKDVKLFNVVAWRRVVLDEAQNIKNPKAVQTKAILKLKAPHRLALTGTPVENRLMDLWSIFNFLNPGYLNTQTRFRKNFELPVQRDNDPVQTATLKRLVEPFILRRVKTDKNIIKDLPDKVEARQYCNLSKEQASLYEAVVRDVEQQLEEKEGIERQGLMLSTLMKLKQICNHPAQFLQDNSAFTVERSHKLKRLGEMLEEVMAEGDSVLIFSQFTDIGANLEKYLKHSLHYNTYCLHGGTARARREKMIAQFQDPETVPSIFILSVKAGGVGITLTKANHVFHFDRWWNPAVEDQATDRAFRIGQEKNVFVHKFVTLGTLEERIDQMIEDKKAFARAIVGNDESWLAQLDNERFKELICLNRETVVE